MYQLVGALLVCFLAISFFVLMLTIVLDGLKLILFRVAGTKSLEELGTRFDAHHAEWVKERLARGEPVTLGGVLKLLGWRIWTAYRHPIRAWWGDLDRPKQGTTDARVKRP
jgi:hypothetical protein